MQLRQGRQVRDRGRPVRMSGLRRCRRGRRRPLCRSSPLSVAAWSGVPRRGASEPILRSPSHGGATSPAFRRPRPPPAPRRRGNAPCRRRSSRSAGCGFPESPGAGGLPRTGRGRRPARTGWRGPPDHRPGGPASSSRWRPRYRRSRRIRCRRTDGRRPSCCRLGAALHRRYGGRRRGPNARRRPVARVQRTCVPRLRPALREMRSTVQSLTNGSQGKIDNGRR